MSKEVYLIDSNALMTPHLTYYPFDFAPSFWAQLESHINNGSIVILDMVKAEVLKGDDNLSKWMSKLEIGCLIDHREPNILSQYGAVLEHIQSNKCYKSSALAEWSKASVADPWLIATAAANHLTIVTFEKSNAGLSEHRPSKNAKIPDVAKVFNVKVQDLYYMMRQLGFHL